MGKKMKKALAAALSLLLFCALLSALSGCGSSGSGSKPASQPVEETGGINEFQQRAYNAAREANLRMIDSAIQFYYAENEAYPTSLTQLTQFFARGVPADPMGGTYYIITQGGVAKAAVR